jgi:hypothetical protein
MKKEIIELDQGLIFENEERENDGSKVFRFGLADGRVIGVKPELFPGLREGIIPTSLEQADILDQFGDRSWQAVYIVFHAGSPGKWETIKVPCEVFFPTPRSHELAAIALKQKDASIAPPTCPCGWSHNEALTWWKASRKAHNVERGSDAHRILVSVHADFIKGVQFETKIRLDEMGLSKDPWQAFRHGFSDAYRALLKCRNGRLTIRAPDYQNPKKRRRILPKKRRKAPGLNCR